MNYLSGIDKITSTDYGFRVLSSNKKEEATTPENVLIGIARIISGSTAEKETDPLALQAEDLIYSTLLEGEIKVVNHNLKGLDEQTIADLFKEIFAPFQNRLVIGHQHLPRKVIVRNLNPMANPLHHNPLLLFYGSCGAGITHTPTIQQKIDFFEAKLREFESQRSIDPDKFSLLTKHFTKFTQSAEGQGSQDSARIQSLGERIDKVKRASQKSTSGTGSENRSSGVTLTAAKPHQGPVIGPSSFKNELSKRVLEVATSKPLHQTLGKADPKERTSDNHESSKHNAELADPLAAAEAKFRTLENAGDNAASFLEFMREFSAMIAKMDSQTSDQDKARIQALHSKIQELGKKIALKSVQGTAIQRPKTPPSEQPQPSTQSGDRLTAAEAQLQTLEQAASLNENSLLALGKELNAILAEMGSQISTRDFERIQLMQTKMQGLIKKIESKTVQKNVEYRPQTAPAELPKPCAKPKDRLAAAEAQFQLFQVAVSVNGDSLLAFGNELSAILREMGNQPPAEDLARIWLMINKMEDLQTKIKI